MNDLAISGVFLPFKLFRLLRLLTVPSLGDRCWHALSQQALSRGNGDGTREKDAQFLLSLAAKILVNYASSFRRRVIQPVESFPLRLLKFANKSSEVLKSLADELLDSHSSTLDHSALKFREAFESDLKCVSQNGTLPPRVATFVSGLKQHWRADVRVPSFGVSASFVLRIALMNVELLCFPQFY